jgi:hypothetical protein
MQLTSSFVVLLHQFMPVFTEPTYRTFVQIVTGWILSHRQGQRALWAIWVDLRPR